jgi:hypothetical protein
MDHFHKRKKQQMNKNERPFRSRVVEQFVSLVSSIDWLVGHHVTRHSDLV